MNKNNNSSENPHLRVQMEMAERKMENQENVDTPGYSLMAKVAQPDKFLKQLSNTMKSDRQHLLDEVRDKLAGSAPYLSDNSRPKKTDD